jgi:hypothetical protein
LYSLFMTLSRILSNLILVVPSNVSPSGPGVRAPLFFEIFI